MAHEFIALDTVKNGVLDIGEETSWKHFADLAKSIKFTPETKQGESLEVLSGKKIPSTDTVEWKLSFSIYDDYGMKDSLKEYLISNHGKVVPFRCKPYGSRDRYIVGTLQLQAVAIGGEVGGRDTEEVSCNVLTWKFVGEADLNG